MNSINYNSMNERLEELNEFARYEGTEWGEMIVALSGIARYLDYVDDALTNSIVAEIDSQLSWANKNLRIVEVETFTRTVKSVEQI